MLTLAITTALCLQVTPPRVVITRMPARGLEREVGVSRRSPSDVLRIGGLDYVFYTRSEGSSLHYPRKYSGSIWYATSQDEGHSWVERGLVLDHGEAGRFDDVAVFDPCIARDDHGAILMFYAAISAPFNYRFEQAAMTNAMTLGVAELKFDDQGSLAQVERLTQAPILGPSSKISRGFDSLRVSDPSVIVRDGLFHLYYQGRPFPEADDRTATGLVVSQLPTGPFVRPALNAPVQSFAKETFVWPFINGTLSLVTQSERALYWAVDGVHFARVIERVEGSLNEPGLAPSDQGMQKWGLHVARYSPDPYLERFELKLIGDVKPPPVTVLAAPSKEDRAAAAGWSAGGDWLAQHRDILAISARRPKDFILLGDSITQGWGGAGRAVSAPGAAAFAEHFGEMDSGNYGVSGDRTQQVLWRMDSGEFARSRSKLVVLLIGTNNIGHDTPREIAAGVYQVLTRLRQLMPQGEVLLLGILPRGAEAGDAGGQAARQTNELLADFDRMPRVTYMDLSSTLADNQGVPQREFFAADSLHLSPAGYHALAEALHLPIATLMLPPQLR